MRNKKILYISQEITPYLPSSEISDICRQAPLRVSEKGYEVRTFMPKYGPINERRNQLHEVIRLSGANIIIDDTDHPLILKVATLAGSRMQVYFIDNDEYFQHGAAKKMEITEMPEENDERQMFFARGVMETIKKLKWEPAVMHCSGWFTALVPMYVRRAYASDPTVGPAKVVYALFDEGFTGTLDSRFREKLQMDGFTDEDIEILGGEPVDAMTLMKLGIQYADAVVKGSDKAPEELLDYAKELGKPIFEITDKEVDGAQLTDFYNQL